MPNLVAGLDIAIADTASLTAGLDLYISDSRSTDLDVLVAESRNFFTLIDVLAAATQELTVDMDFCVVAESSDSKLISSQLDIAIAESRNIPVNLDVLLELGVTADLDVLVQGESTVGVGLQVYVKSEDLQIGASALYIEDADEVESVLYVEDGDVLHPEYVDDLTATLVYKGKHNIGSVTFDKEYGDESGTITLLWAHPAHKTDLSVRFTGSVQNLGDVDFTVEVSDDALADIPLGENILEGVDNEQERTEYDSSQALTHTLDAAPEEIDVVSTAVVLTLFRINLLSQYNWLETGKGSPEYTGGGNRLLTALGDASFVYQDKDAFPPPINAYTRIESAGTNLLDNSNFLTETSSIDPTPNGWTLDSDASITYNPSLIEEDSGVNYLRVRAWGSGAFVGAKEISFTYDSAVTATDADPVTFSILARTEYGTDDVIVDHLRLVISFRDGSDTEISQTIADFDPEDIKGTQFVLLHNTVAAPPVGTAAVRVWVDMNSIETSDDFTIDLMAPQLELTDHPSSRIVGTTAPTNRAVDTFRIPQEGNIELRRGSFITIFASDYDNTPAVDACVFDTRDASGLNGFVLYHLANGKLRFEVSGPTTPVILETNATFDFTSGIYQEIGVSWSTGFMEIQYNSDVVATYSGGIVAPQELQDWIYLFRTQDGSNQLEGELGSFEIRRDVQE